MTTFFLNTDESVVQSEEFRFTSSIALGGIISTCSLR